MADDVSSKVKLFFSQFPERKYQKGQLLLYAGDQPERIYYLEKGNVRQYDISYRGDQLVLNVFKPEAFFPMNYVIADINNSFFFECETAVVARVAPVDTVKQFLSDNPDVTYDLLARVYRGMDGVLGRVRHLMAGSAKGRVIYELIIECKRLKKPDDKGRYFIPLHESDLASRAGLTRETVSREIQKIGKEGLLSVNQKGIEVTDLGKLETMLGPEL